MMISVIKNFFREERELVAKALLFMIVPFIIIGCSGGGDSGDGADTNNLPAANQTPTASSKFSGVAQLGYIQNGDVFLYDYKDLDTAIASTKTSSSLDTSDAGSFTFNDVKLESSKYYVLKITGGYDVDVDDNGIVNENDKEELKGAFHLVATGESLISSSSLRINVLSELIYQDIKSDLSTLTTAEINQKISEKIPTLVNDVNNDGKVDIDDIISFDPVEHKMLTKIDYGDLLSTFIPHLHANSDDKTLLSSKLFLNEPILEIENGFFQEVPFELNLSVTNLPTGLEVEYLLNDKQPSTSITEDGAYNVVAMIKHEGETIKTLAQTLSATQKTKLDELTTSTTQEVELIVVDENTPDSLLNGTKVTIPSGALTADTKISISKSSVNNLPNSDGTAVGDVLVLEPAGLVFEKPVTVTIPYNSALISNPEDLFIARYSNDGTLDYLSPLYVDTVAHEVVFQTEHFTKFQLKDKRFGTPSKLTQESQEEIDALEELTGLSYTNSEWEAIMNKIPDVKIPKNMDKINLFDVFTAYNVSKKINKNVSEDDFMVMYESYDNYYESSYVKFAVNAMKAKEWHTALTNPPLWMITNTFKQGFKVIRNYNDIAFKFQLQQYFNIRKKCSYEELRYDLISTFGSSELQNFTQCAAYQLKNGYFNGYAPTDIILRNDIEDFWNQVERLYYIYSTFNEQEDKEYLINTIKEAKKELDDAKNPYLQFSSVVINGKPKHTYGYSSHDVTAGKPMTIKYSLDSFGYGDSTIAPFVGLYNLDDQLVAKMETKELSGTFSYTIPEFFKNSYKTYYLKAHYNNKVAWTRIELKVLEAKQLSFKNVEFTHGKFQSYATTTEYCIIPKANFIDHNNNDIYPKYTIEIMSAIDDTIKTTGLNGNQWFCVDFTKDALKDLLVITEVIEQSTYTTSSGKYQFNSNYNLLKDIEDKQNNSLSDSLFYSDKNANEHYNTREIELGESIEVGLYKSGIEKIIYYSLDGTTSTTTQGSDISDNLVYKYRVAPKKIGEYTPRMFVEFINGARGWIYAPTVSVFEIGNNIPTVTVDNDLYWVNAGESVALTAHANDTDGSISKIQWTQLSGSKVILNNATRLNASFVAPQSTTNPSEELVFEIKVTDDKDSTATDKIKVSVASQINEDLGKVTTTVEKSNINVDEGATATLKGSATTTNGFINIYRWNFFKSDTNNKEECSQITLSGNKTQTATFIAPNVESQISCTFLFTAIDNKIQKDTEFVEVVISSNANEQEESSNGITQVNNLIYGKIDYRNDFGEKLDIPTDMWVRVTPSILQNDAKGWNGLRCRVDASGSFGQECYIYGDDTELQTAFANPSETYQIVVFKNYIEPEQFNWECEEDRYKVGGSETLDVVSNITVMTSDYQTATPNECTQSGEDSNSVNNENKI